MYFAKVNSMSPGVDIKQIRFTLPALVFKSDFILDLIYFYVAINTIL